MTPEASLDRKQVFLLFATLCGNVAQTAAALNISEATIQRLVDEEKWQEKIKSIVEMRNSGKPHVVERAINRAINFTQAHRLRLFVDRVLQKLTDMTDAELEEYVFCSEIPAKPGKPGAIVAKLNTRPIADLVAAAEKAQSLSYAALGDSPTERIKREAFVNDTVGESASEIGAKIALAMQEVVASETPRALLFDQQLREAQTVEKKVKEKTAKSDSYDSDDH